MTKVKKYKGNRIAILIEEKTLKAADKGAEKKKLISNLQAKTGLTRRLSALINNTYQPSVEELLIIAEELGVTLNDLVEVDR